MRRKINLEIPSCRKQGFTPQHKQQMKTLEKRGTWGETRSFIAVRQPHKWIRGGTLVQVFAQGMFLLVTQGNSLGIAPKFQKGIRRAGDIFTMYS